MSANAGPLTTAEKTVGILIYPDAEVLDFCGPFEVFATTRLNEETRRETDSPIQQLLVAETTGGGARQRRHAYAGRRGLHLLPPAGHPAGSRRQRSPRPDASAGVSGLAEDTWLRRSTAWPRSAPVPCCWPRPDCWWARRATTHFHSVDFFRERFPRTSLLPELPVVVDGNITTANSIRAGMDMALYLVAQTYGPAIAREAARQMEYPYPDGQYEPPKERQ